MRKLDRLSGPSRVLALACLMVLSSSCAASESAEVAAEQTSASAAAQVSERHVVWVDSYHAEYEWSMAIESGIRSVLEDQGVQITVIRLDTKRVSDDAVRTDAAAEAYQMIQDLDPDVVIASDDNAQSYLVVPHLKGTERPVVFAGVNWDATPYGYPAENVTGMVEIDLVEQLLELMTPIAGGSQVAILSGDTETDRKLASVYNDRFFDGQLPARYVADYAEFKETFLQLQEEVDYLIIGNYVAISDWDPVDAQSWILENTRIPTCSTQTWVAPYALLALGGSGVEQGEWAAQAAVDIMDGSDPADIPIAENRSGELVVNLEIADAIGLALPTSILRNARIYEPNGG